MTAKNRNKASSGEKTTTAAAAAPPSSAQVDASTKVQKSSDEVSGAVTTPKSPGSGPSSDGGGGGGFQVLLLLFSVALVAGGGFAAFYLQQALEEVHQIGAKNQETALENAKLHGRMESVLEQVDSVRRVVEGLEASLAVTRSELGAAGGRLRQGEEEKQRLEEALQRLQNDLLQDLSAGISQVKEARERDFSSLESTVETRLAEVGQSVASSVAELAAAQGEVRGQLAGLQARLGEAEDPAVLRGELAVVAGAVEELEAASRASEAGAVSLAEQIGGVSAELQTRNGEVASLAQEVDAVRALVQDTVGSLKGIVTAAEAGVTELRAGSEELEAGLGRAQEAVGRLREEAREQTLQRSVDLEARVKASEEAAQSVAELSSRVEALLASHDSHDSALAAHGQAAEKARAGLAEELEQLRAGVEEVRSSADQGSLGGLTEALDSRLSTLEESTRDSIQTPQRLEELRAVVVALEGKAARLEQHEQAISTLQDALKKTTTTLAALSTKKIKAKKP
ncbi:cytoskeleton-associated protein 4 [Gadus morhua]|uniref:cytoskeleton-associated protein 4 n=1 Tax=Gadus morhua TaxID=8049 RepID=UPI0011B7431F|nr:cytoskeleton-associated protein 4 [Gadus morhua]